MNINQRKSYLICTLIILITLFLIAFFFNYKLNNQFRELLNLKNVANTANVSSKYEIKEEWKYPVPDKYSVNSNYFLLSDIDKLKKDYNHDNNNVLMTKWGGEKKRKH